jgi:hypothetical protein
LLLDISFYVLFSKTGPMLYSLIVPLSCIWTVGRRCSFSGLLIGLKFEDLVHPSYCCRNFILCICVHLVLHRFFIVKTKPIVVARLKAVFISYSYLACGIVIMFPKPARIIMFSLFLHSLLCIVSWEDIFFSVFGRQVLFVSFLHCFVRLRFGVPDDDDIRVPALPILFIAVAMFREESRIMSLPMVDICISLYLLVSSAFGSCRVGLLFVV